MLLSALYARLITLALLLALACGCGSEAKSTSTSPNSDVMKVPGGLTDPKAKVNPPVAPKTP